MKTEAEVVAAKKRIVARMIATFPPGSIGKNGPAESVLIGMVNALDWVVDGKNSSTIEDVLAGRPFGGKQT